MYNQRATLLGTVLLCFAVSVLGRTVRADKSSSESRETRADFGGCFFVNFAEFYQPGLNNATIENYTPGLCRHVVYCCNVIKYNATTDEFSIVADAFGSQLPDFHRLQSKDPAIKSILSVSADSSASPLLVSDATNGASYRAKMIAVLIAYLRANNLGGVGLNFGHPGLCDSNTWLDALLTDIHEAFKVEAKSSGKQQLILTISVEGYRESARTCYNAKVISKTANFALLNDYFFNYTENNGVYTAQASDSTYFISPQSGPENPQSYNDKYFNVESIAKYWVEDLGLAREKLVIKVPTYGRGWVLANASDKKQSAGAAISGMTPQTQAMRVPGLAAYFEICSQQNLDGAVSGFDFDQGAPYLNVNGNWYGFDNSVSTRNKVALAREENYAGVIATQLQYDDVTGSCGEGKFPLVAAGSD